MQYNKDNIFYKIIHKELKSHIVLEGEHYIVINDIKPKAPVHMLVIPKGEYISWDDFVLKASPSEIVDFCKGIEKTVDMMHLKEGGYRLIVRAGKFGPQEVPHLHVHVLGDSKE